MKLRTKFQDEDFELGEVVDVTISNLLDGKFVLTGEASKGGVVTMYYESLQELYDNWEDVPKEPKEYWAIDVYSRGADDFMDYNDSVDIFNKSIGNYFETKEEGEKAVEKLKAWKRLNEAGLKIEAENVSDIDSIKDGYVDFDLHCYFKRYYGFGEDMDTLFGGK